MSRNLGYTILLVAGIIIFLYASDADIIGGLLTAGAALVIYVSGTLLYGEYKRTPVRVVKTATVSKPAQKKPAATKKKSVKKK